MNSVTFLVRCFLEFHSINGTKLILFVDFSKCFFLVLLERVRTLEIPIVSTDTPLYTNINIDNPAKYL